MYKIFTQYGTKNYWIPYTTSSEDGEIIEFSTDSTEELESTIETLLKTMGSDKIKAVKDITVEIVANITE